jgi:hypothetical protein
LGRLGRLENLRNWKTGETAELGKLHMGKLDKLGNRRNWGIGESGETVELGKLWKVAPSKQKRGCEFFGGRLSGVFASGTLATPMDYSVCNIQSSTDTEDV